VPFLCVSLSSTLDSDALVFGDTTFGGLGLVFLNELELAFTLLLLSTCKTRSLSILSSAFRKLYATLLASNDCLINGLTT
jgi:hypothetical protein